ncbi:hypothetical protein GGR57DRAFT_415659 [Xylariaceae sp. FL1272]|nr:hypothetical protein GGR57DRAFT_415659 [Xylariaceae sp. FL1272]
MASSTSIWRKRKGLNPRPFYATILLLSSLAAYSLLLRTFPPAHHQHEHHGLLPRDSGAQECRFVHKASDQCAFVKRNCHDDEAGLLEYLTLYYCKLGSAQPLAFIILVVWLGLLFTTIGIAASDFFSVNLSTISQFLGLSESLAGVTFLAFGNGSPDVFSTFAAMNSNSGSMALGELIGAAGFITSVVAGSMALVREFKVNKKAFVRDICFFIVAVGFAVSFLYDGNLHLWECAVMIGFYLFYVIVVVGWHAYSKRRSARKVKEAASRGHFYRSASERDNEELEPYRDYPDEEDQSAGAGRASAAPDIGVLDRAPLIEIGRAGQEADDDFESNQHAAAEMASSMRLNRPWGRRNTTTITPIRPSLVGALEFRSVLSSLQKEGNVRMRPIHARSHSINHLRVNTDFFSAQSNTQTTTGHEVTSATNRNRALSSGNIPKAIDADIAGVPTNSHTIGGRLAPPPVDVRMPNPSAPENGVPEAVPTLPQLRIPLSDPSSTDVTPSPSPLSPFPQFTESPLIMTPNPQEPSHLSLPSPAEESGSVAIPSLPRQTDPKPVPWWPYKYLPAPHVLVSTLLPTFQNWHSKSMSNKFLSIITAPSIFLLVITLPVVDSETAVDDADEESMNDERVLAEAPAHMGAAVRVEPSGSLEPETEWQRYRRSTHSSPSSRSPSPDVSNHTASRDSATSAESLVVPPLPDSELRQHTPGSVDTLTLYESDEDWNRWLLILQIFTGPLFCVFVFWANVVENLERPIRVLVRAVLISLVFSLALLGLLLATTTPNRRPKYHVAFCFLGFIIAIAWISTVAGEVVGVLKAFGVIFNISEAILGLTIFAVGNSVGDLVADITVARLGLPVMALSACFGGPLLNILLGIGLGGAYQTINAANKHHIKHPNKPYRYKPYHIQVTGTLLVSAIALLVTLLALLVVVPMNKWMMTRKIGFGLIAFWLASVVVNLTIEITGVWGDVA